MSIFAIADTHLSFGTDKPMNVFSGWSDHILRLKNNWERLVEPDDTVVIAGDISWAMNLDEALDDFKFLQSLPGKKIIMKGNHDYWWTSRAKMEGFFAANGLDSLSVLHNNAISCEGMAVCGTRGWFFDAQEDDRVLLRERMRLVRSIEAAHGMQLEPIVFLHYPPVYDGQVCEEIFGALKEYGINRCYYGHVHGYAIPHAATGIFDGIDLRLISCDAVNFTPVPVHVSYENSFHAY
ncbi:MAG: metallophosphoesterase [Clostridia bacterium]|nr:metallophosphoesterase [Clostridia bacterium]